MEDQGSYLTIGGGVVTIIVIATAFSAFMENRAVKADVKKTTQTHVDEDREILENLQYEVSVAKRRWEEVSDRKQRHATFEVKKKMVAESQSRIARLVAKKKELGEGLAQAQEDFTRYRRDYRNWIWRTAEGESIGSLRTLDGREYHQAVISKVTEEGLEIRHDFGMARIGSGQLPDSWHDRFQWRTGVSVSSVK